MCRIKVISGCERTIIRRSVCLWMLYCVPSLHNYSSLNAFECMVALQQGGIKSKWSHYIIQHVSTGSNVSAEQRDHRLKLALTRKKEEEGSQEELFEFSKWCQTVAESTFLAPVNLDSDEVRLIKIKIFNLFIPFILQLVFVSTNYMSRHRKDSRVIILYKWFWNLAS